ncbi:MAG TPA: hypothetical protein VF682_17185 [Pseudomonas sp.]
MPMGKGDGLDAGNYKSYPEGCAFYPSLMLVAQEMGDKEVYEFARDRYDALPVENIGGALRHGGSTAANLTAAVARLVHRVPGIAWAMSNYQKLGVMDRASRTHRIQTCWSHGR